MRVVVALAIVLKIGTPTRAQQADLNLDSSEQGRASAVSLARALEARLRVWSREGRPVYVRHCRQTRTQGGCRARLISFARIIDSAAHRHGVDPFLLAAMALRESGLNPFAEGAAGERGIVQLHPRGIGYHVPFVRSKAYRRRCERRSDACQEEVVDSGAAHLASAVQRCGSVAAGLGAYNTGVCQTTGYTRRVLEERQRLLQLAKANVPARAILVD